MSAVAATRPRTRGGLATAGLILLLLLAAFYLFGAIADLAAIAGHRLPADHQGTFSSLAGQSYAHAQAAAHGISADVFVLERGYALHELTFALLFITVIAIAFRRRPALGLIAVQTPNPLQAPRGDRPSARSW